MELGPIAQRQVKQALKAKKASAENDILGILQEHSIGDQKYVLLNTKLIAHAQTNNWNNFFAYLSTHFANDKDVQLKLAQNKTTVLHEGGQYEQLQTTPMEIEQAIPEEVNAFAQKHGFVRPGEVFDYRKHAQKDGQSIYFKAIAEKDFNVAKWLDENWPKEVRRPLLESDEFLELQLKYWAIDANQKEIIGLLTKHQYDVKNLFDLSIQDKKLQYILVAALNSEKEEDNFTARGLMMLGVRLPTIFKLTDAGNKKHHEITTEISLMINALIEENHRRKMEYVITDALSENKNQAKTVMDLCQTLAEQTPEVTPIPTPPVTSLAFQGGGPRGACYNGVSQALEQLRVNPQVKCVAGSSAGAITALGFAFGLNAEQFATLSGQLDFQDLLDNGGSYFGAIWYAYIYSGQNFHDWARMLCLAVLGDPDATFEDLNKAISNPKHPYYTPSLKHLIITGTQLLKDGTSQTITFSSLDPATHQVKIADAVRSSMSIPGVYKPWEIVGKDGKDWGTFVDGGVLNNFPINLLDRAELTKTHLGIEYKLEQKTTKHGLIQVNPCSFGFTFVDTLAELKPKVTPLTPHLAENVRSLGVTLVDDTQVAPIKHEDVGVMAIINQIYTAYKGQTNQENLVEKCEHHQGNVVQMFPEGISLLDFNAPKEKIDRAAQTAKESTLLTFQQKSLSNQHTGGCIVEVLSLEEYLILFFQEMSKYEANELRTMYKPEELLNNVTLQFISKKIQDCLATRPDKSVPEETYLADKIAMCREMIQHKQALIARADQRLQTVMDDQRYLNTVTIEIKKSGITPAFKTLIDGQLTRVIELCRMPSNYHDNLNLLQLAAKAGNFDALDYMLSKLKSAYKHRQVQKKATKPGEGFADILNEVNGGVLASLITANIDPNKKLLCLAILKKHPELNPVAVNAAGLTPLHIAAKQNQPELFIELMALISDKYFYQKNFQTLAIADHHLKEKETLFEYILREAPLELVAKIMQHPSIKEQKLFYYPNVVNNQFTMEELFANYCKEKPDLWKAHFQAYWGYPDAKDHHGTCLRGFEGKAKVLASKHEAITRERERKEALYVNFNKLFGVDLAHSTGGEVVHQNINMANLEQTSPQDLCEMMSLSLQEHSEANGLNLLCYACKMGQFEAVAKIIEKLEAAKLKEGILPLLTTKCNEYAPLMWAISACEKHPENALKIVTLLRDKGVIGEHIHQAGQANASCAITCAAKLGHNAVVEVLCDKVITRKTPDSDGRTLLHYLAMNPETRPELFHRIMVGRPENWVYSFKELCVVDQYGKTPFHYLIDNGREDIIEHIIETNIARRGYTGIGFERPMTLDEAFDFAAKQDTYATPAKPYCNNLTLLEYAAFVNSEFAEFLALKLDNGTERLQRAREQPRSAPQLPVEDQNQERRKAKAPLHAFELDRAATQGATAVSEDHKDKKDKAPVPDRKLK